MDSPYWYLDQQQKGEKMLVTVKDIVNDEDLMKPFKVSLKEGQEVTFDKESQIEKLVDNFDYIKGQIVSLVCKTKFNGGDNNFRTPAIITKVHEPDINGHNTYDIIVPVRGACEFISFLQDKERYLWRFTDRVNTIPDEWIIQLMQLWKKEHGQDMEVVENEYGLKLEELCYFDNKLKCFNYFNRGDK